MVRRPGWSIARVRACLSYLMRCSSGPELNADRFIQTVCVPELPHEVLIGGNPALEPHLETTQDRSELAIGLAQLIQQADPRPCEPAAQSRRRRRIVEVAFGEKSQAQASDLYEYHTHSFLPTAPRIISQVGRQEPRRPITEPDWQRA